MTNSSMKPMHVFVILPYRGNDFKLDVSEWYYFKNKLIDKIIAYYHIGELREDRKLKL